MTRWMLAFLALCGAVAAPTVVWADDDPEDRASVIQEAMELPEATQQLREAGVDETRVSETLRTLRENLGEEGDEAREGDQADTPDTDRGSAASRAARVMSTEAEMVREHGPMENFDDFVRDQVEQGVHGQELAESIREQKEGRTGPPQRVDDERGDPPERVGGAVDERSEQKAGDRRPEQQDQRDQGQDRRKEVDESDEDDGVGQGTRQQKRDRQRGQGQPVGDAEDDEEQRDESRRDEQRQRGGGR